MNETWASGTQAGEAQGTEAQGDEADADGALDDETLAEGEESDSPDVEKLRRLRLGEFLRELVRQEGKMEATELLGVNYKTLVRAEKSGEITGRMADALERLLGTADDPEVVRLRERMGTMEERMEALEDGMKALRGEVQRGSIDPPRAAVAGEATGQTEGQDTAAAAEGGGENEAQARDGKGADQAATEAAPSVAGLRSKKPFSEHRLDPEVVTEGPADDDPEVYGDAWPLVEEWRSLRAGHPHQGKSLSWLVTEERLLTLELAMLEEHGLTLPPEKQPLRGFGRRGQTSWRWKALADTRVALRKRELLRWVRRACTLGLWSE